MIISLTSSAFDALADGVVPSGLRFMQDSAIAPREVLRMLSDLNRAIAADFTPSAWMIVDGDEVVGLCSIIRPPENGELHIGYGVAPSREGRGGWRPQPSRNCWTGRAATLESKACLPKRLSTTLPPSACWSAMAFHRRGGGATPKTARSSAGRLPLCDDVDEGVALSSPSGRSAGLADAPTDTVKLMSAACGGDRPPDAALKNNC